jgi:ABC-type multidrug transport system ATPase subunit
VTGGPAAVIEARRVGRRFRATVALDDVSLSVPPGRIHALLGPNGAGKTTLLRVLGGAVAPTAGTISVLGLDSSQSPRELRQRIGFVSSGERSFYLRISGFENLLFFGRLYGLRRRAAASRARELLEQVDLADAMHVRVGEYSHGMQKRLAVARALVLEPPVLLVDEATHDLDPAGARRVRALVSRLAGHGTAVVWATQRLDEIRDFAHRVTLLHRGRVQFEGTVGELVALADARTYLLHLRNGQRRGSEVVERLQAVLGGAATIETSAGHDHHFVLSLKGSATLGDALGLVLASGVEVIGCSEARSGIEAGFLRLTESV